MGKLIDTFVTLPQALVDDFEKIDFSKAERNHALKFINNLMKRSFREYGMIDGFVETPSNYFRKVFTTKYLDWLNKLIFAKIIISNTSYSNYSNNNYSKSFSLNTTYISSPTIMLLLFGGTPLKSVPYTFKIKDVSNEDKVNYEKVIEDLITLKIDKEGLKLITEKEVEKIKIGNYNINENVTRDAFNVYFDGEKKDRKYWMTKEQALEKSEKLKKTLIQDGDKFYIINQIDFITRKKNSVLISYNDAINKMSNKKFYGKRNPTNNRLDTNMTNMAKVLTNYICEKNKLSQFDLMNAQFAILSDYLEDKLNTLDFQIFKEQSYNGTLYEYIMEKLNIKSRLEAKKMMFELMFSKEDYSTPLKNKLSKIFPSVVKIVDEYKKQHGYNNFSIMLQKKESEIFIDGLWKNIKKKKIFCTPKHDCLVVREKDADKVEEIVREYFEKIGFKGRIIKE